METTAMGWATMTVMVTMTMAVMAYPEAKAEVQGSDCSTVMMTLSPCLDFIGGKSPDPGLTCCTTLGGVVQSDPHCLCMVMDGSATSFGIAVNRTRALELPGICKVQAPPISRCTGVAGSLAPVEPPVKPPPVKPPVANQEDAEETADAPKGIPGSSAKSSSRNSKAASIMATLIPVCALFYVF